MESSSSYIAFLESTLAEPGCIALDYFDRAIEVQQKLDSSPVTIADLEVEAHLRRQLGARYPDHGILGEEQNA